MSLEHLEVLVEEPSMEVALRLLMPKILGQRSFQIYPSQCKDELLLRLPDRLRGYANWLPQDWHILVVVDRDSDDCQLLKHRLDDISITAGLTPKSHAPQGRFSVTNRLAIEELEAWYFGDWDAVRAAYPRVPPNAPRRARFRDPDAIAGGTWETFEQVLRSSGYFSSGLRKIEAARNIAVHMDPWRNRSHSFGVLRDALVGLCS